MLGLKDVFKIPLLKWCMCLQLRYIFPSVIHKLLHQAVAQFSLTLKETFCRYHSNHQQPIYHVLVLQHHDKLWCHMHVPTLMINIALLHSNIAPHSHQYFPIYYLCQKKYCSVLQHFNNAFTNFRFSCGILFSIIRQKRMKDRLTRHMILCQQWTGVMWRTEML